MDSISAVLFACTLNAVRSPIAEAYFRHLFGHRIYVDSCGARPEGIDAFAIEVMEEIGIDISDHQPKSFDDLEDGSFDLIISLSPEAQHQAVEMTRVMACDVEYWQVMDPGIIDGPRDRRLEVYRMIRDDLIKHIHDRFPTGGPQDT